MPITRIVEQMLQVRATPKSQQEGYEAQNQACTVQHAAPIHSDIPPSHTSPPKAEASSGTTLLNLRWGTERRIPLLEDAIHASHGA